MTPARIEPQQLNPETVELMEKLRHALRDRDGIHGLAIFGLYVADSNIETLLFMQPQVDPVLMADVLQRFADSLTLSAAHFRQLATPPPADKVH